MFEGIKELWEIVKIAAGDAQFQGALVKLVFHLLHLLIALLALLHKWL